MDDAHKCKITRDFSFDGTELSISCQSQYALDQWAVQAEERPNTIDFNRLLSEKVADFRRELTKEYSKPEYDMLLDEQVERLIRFRIQDFMEYEVELQVDRVNGCIAKTVSERGGLFGGPIRFDRKNENFEMYYTLWPDMRAEDVLDKLLQPLPNRCLRH